MKNRSLLNKTLTQFSVCTIVILLLSAPIFYLLTKHYYAEDMIDLVEAVKQGNPLPENIDLEEDIMIGIMLQYTLISFAFGIAIVLMMRVIARRLWIPFDKMLETTENFHFESNTLPMLPTSDIKEFCRLNQALSKLMGNSLKSYRVQKEFTENASHELQTPLAIFQNKLELMLQQPDLTEKQAVSIQELYQISNRMSLLNRNLLLLAKIENNQYLQKDTIEVTEKLIDILPTLEGLANGIVVSKVFSDKSLVISGNITLFECLVYNLFVNAIRHNKPSEGSIEIYLIGNELSIYNTSDENGLNEERIFSRFYRTSENMKGNGLGLSIAKAICDYHGWLIRYRYVDKKHIFTVKF